MKKESKTRVVAKSWCLVFWQNRDVQTHVMRRIRLTFRGNVRLVGEGVTGLHHMFVLHNMCGLHNRCGYTRDGVH